FGPEPSGPLYYGAHKFLQRLDPLVYGTAAELASTFGQTVSAWLSGNTGACLTVAFALFILLGGSLQWFLLGKLAQWTTARRGWVPSAVLGAYAVWAAVSLFLWIAAWESAGHKTV